MCSRAVATLGAVRSWKSNCVLLLWKLTFLWALCPTSSPSAGETLLLLAATKADGLRMLSVWEDTAGQRQALEGSINSRFDIDALLVIDA